ncbi:uncharacterized protein [Montipora capricornis]|uniref:uncharacterized protein n=1 Tax=Montipora capricornis TaxID=246305 RepID=UPI0035F168C8
MKLLPMKYRETQSEFFGKRGMNWHFSAVVHSSDHPDCKPTECEYQIHAYIAVFDSCKQDWFSVSCILEEVLSTVKETHPSVKRAILRSDNAGCYHNSALLSTIHSTSKRSGIEVVRYDFSDPQAGKDLCDRRIAPCKQRLRNYVAENNDIQTAQDVKNALESPPSITGTRVAVCTVDPSQMSTKVASNKIPNITKYNNFSFERDIITVWQAYGIGAGQKIPNSSFMYTQDTSGLRRVGEWSQESIITTQRRQAGAGTKDPLNPVATFPCMEPACIQTFSTLQEADDHMDTGRHVLLQEKESVYDTIRRQWASIATSVKGQSQKPICPDYQSDAAIAGGLQGTPGEAQLGWALKKAKANVRISPAVKEFLTNVFDEGNKDGKQKANPTEIAEEIKKNFKRNEWLETQTVKGFFSRLAARQRGQEIGSQQDHDQDLALEREVFLQDLEEQVNREVGLGHPVEYEDVNLCQLYHQGRFEQFLTKLKISDLRSMCNQFNVALKGPLSRKATFIQALQELVTSCSCLCDDH